MINHNLQQQQQQRKGERTRASPRERDTCSRYESVAVAEKKRAGAERASQRTKREIYDERGWERIGGRDRERVRIHLAARTCARIARTCVGGARGL